MQEHEETIISITIKPPQLLLLILTLTSYLKDHPEQRETRIYNDNLVMLEAFSKAYIQVIPTDKQMIERLIQKKL